MSSDIKSEKRKPVAHPPLLFTSAALIYFRRSYLLPRLLLAMVRMLRGYQVTISAHAQANMREL